jgi:hypothetical protein
MTKIYYLHRGNNIPFYIGKTINEKDRKHQHKNKLGKDVTLEVIDEIPTKEWRYWEEFYISLFKHWGFELENKNNGGCGSIGGYKNPLTSEAHKGRISPNKNKGKKIIQYDLTGKFINEWDNINEAILTLNLTITNESIRQCLIGKSKKSANFIWRNLTQDYPIHLSSNEVEYILKKTNGPKGQKLNTGKKISQSLKGKRKSPQFIKNISKPVAQYDKQGNYLTQYKSIAEAALAVNGWNENICQCCKGKKKSSAGYFWQYL